MYIRRLSLVAGVIVLGLLFGAAGLPSARPVAAFDTSGKQVWVYYMGFWGGEASWDMQADILTDYPLLGKYDSRDPAVAATQIEQAKGAGIDAFLVSWFGLGDQLTTTPVLNNMLDRASERGFSVGAVVDIYDPKFNSDPSGLVDSLNWLAHDKANHPAYLRYNGKPVIFFAFQDRLGLSTDQWLSIRNQVDPNRQTIWIAEGINGCCLYGGAMDGMYAFNLAWAYGSASRFAYEKNQALQNGASMYIPTIHPGWDESKIAARDGRPNPTSPKSRAGGQFLRYSFNGAAFIRPDVILIVSWNEFMENSHIEPSTLYGTQSLDVLGPLVAAWKATLNPTPTPSPTPLPPGSGAEAKWTLNVRAGPGLNYGIIGQIKPGTAYEIVEVKGSWYGIHFNDQVGYVYAPYVTIKPPGSY